MPLKIIVGCHVDHPSTPVSMPAYNSPVAVATAGPHRYPVTPAVWLVVWVSMTFGFLQSLALRISVDIMDAPYLLQQFFGEGAAIAAQVQASQIYQQQRSTLSWCQDGPNPKTAWILASQTLAGSLGRLFAAWLSAAYGRRASVWTSSVVVLAGIVLQATAGQLAQLVLGVVITGLGLGIMYQAVLLEDAEIAPTNKRGMFVSLWQLGDQAGYALSNGIFLFPSILEKTYGWRLALSTALWPAVAIILLLPWLPETPSSLIQRGLLQEGMESLQRIRGPWYGSEALAAEMQLIWKAAGRPQPDTNRVARFSWLTSQLKKLFSQEQLPQLMVVTVLTVLAWLQDLISKQLLVAVIYMPAKRNLRLALSLLPLAANAAGILLVDRWGRKPLLLSGAAVGLALAITALCFRMLPATDSTQQTVYIVLHMMSLVALGWAWPGWVCLLTEHFSLAVRSAGLAITSSIGGFVQGVVYAFAINVVCHLKWGVVLIKALCSLCTLIIVAALLPESKGYPLENVAEVWYRHWLWKAWFDRLSASSRPGRILPCQQGARVSAPTSDPVAVASA